MRDEAGRRVRRRVWRSLLLIGAMAAATDSAAFGQSQQPGANAALKIESIGRQDSRVQILRDDKRTIVDVRSPFGIDKAVIHRAGENWPQPLIVRLHLRGLESFKIDNGTLAVGWSVSSTGEPKTRVTLWQGREEKSLAIDSPFFTPVRIIRGEGKLPDKADDAPAIPLRDGYFEVTLPARLLADNPAQLALHWIDFYRG